MNVSTRILFGLAVAALAFQVTHDAAAQCAVCPTTTSVVAYSPVVVPTTPGLISGWYPGRLLDTWAANRLAFRSAALAAPVTTSMPVTSYRPVTAYQTSYLPVRAYRPVYYAPSVVATTAYSPVVTASAVCCDPCAATVTGYPTSTSACCGTTVSDGGYTVEPTPVPELRQRPANGGQQAEEKSVKEESEPANGQATDASGTNWAPPPLRDLRLESLPDDPQDKVARSDSVEVSDAVYRGQMLPRLTTTGARGTQPTQARPSSIPSRAERDAMWTAVVD